MPMQFPAPLVPATLLRRYKRFLADVVFDDGSTTTAHCANPGAMLGLAVPGSRVWLSPSPNPKAKLAWRWELEDVDGRLVGINTAHPNRLVEEAIATATIRELTGYTSCRREVAYGVNSRIDLLLEGPNGRCFVEVKNVHLRRGDLAEFPDCVTSRGAKHLAELADRVVAGDRAVMLYCIQREDCDSFAIAGDLDPGYARAFAQATAQGVEAYAYACAVTTASILVSRAVALVPMALAH
jgi:sugar fermentation stimulation protein A